MMHKFGVRLPHSVEEALKINEEMGSDFLVVCIEQGDGQGQNCMGSQGRVHPASGKCFASESAREFLCTQL